jgi:hypothetical protein
LDESNEGVVECPEGVIVALGAHPEFRDFDAPATLRLEGPGWAVERLSRASVSRDSGALRALSRLALCVQTHGADPWGDRVETRLRTAATALAREEDTDSVEEVRRLTRALLPPWAPGLERVGALRWGLLEAQARALEVGAATGADAVVLVLHEVVSLSRTKEARRRNNREDVERWIRRVSGGTIAHLKRGQLAGPLPIPGTEGIPGLPLYVGVIRTDLP